MQGKDSESDGDTSGEIPNVLAIENFIPDCVGLIRENWCKKDIILVNDGDEGVAIGFVQFARASQTIDGCTAFGEDNVRVVVCEVIQADLSVACHSLGLWPIQRILYQGVSLYDHLRKERFIKLERLSCLVDHCGSRKYDSIEQTPWVPLQKAKR
jgi:hypothetical protein